MSLGHPDSERAPAPERNHEIAHGRNLASHRDAMPYTKEHAHFWKGHFHGHQSHHLPHGFGHPTIHGDAAGHHHGTKHHAYSHLHNPYSQHAYSHHDGRRGHRHYAGGGHQARNYYDQPGSGDARQPYQSPYEPQQRSASGGIQWPGQGQGWPGQGQPYQPQQRYSDTGGHGSFSGVASWYGEPQGMANGHRFNPEAYTVASKTLPLGSHIRIHANGRSVEAEVTDRGPYVRGRNLDVSRRIARELGFTNAGTTQYTAELLDTGSGGRKGHAYA